MRNRYWGTYCDIVYKRYFFEIFERRARSNLLCLKIICVIFSVLSAVIWSISRSAPVVWACVIALAQIVQTILGFLPMADQINSLRFFVPQLDLLVIDIGKDWLYYLDEKHMDDNEIREKIAYYERKYYTLEDQFLNGIHIPHVKSVVAAAEKDTEAYFRIRYKHTAGGEPCEGDSPTGNECAKGEGD